MKQIVKLILRYFVSLVLVIYSFTIGMLTKTGRGVLNRICVHFGLSKLTNMTVVNLPWISPRDIMDNKNVILYEPVFKSGNVNIGELAVINGIIMKNKPKAIFEIGTFDGRTTLNMAMSSGDDCEIYTLNLSPDEEVSTEFEMDAYDKGLTQLRFESGIRFTSLNPDEVPQIKKIKQMFGDSAKFDFSPYYNKIDFIFIDAAHSYDYVLSDSENALKLLRNGKGIILWHDYKNNMEVVPAIDTIKQRYNKMDIRHIMESDMAYVEIK